MITLTNADYVDLILTLAYVNEDNVPPHLYRKVGDLETKLAKMRCEQAYWERPPASEQDTYQLMDAVEAEVTLLKAKHQKLAKMLDQCVIVREQVEVRYWHGGQSGPVGEIRYWDPTVTHRKFTKDLGQAKIMHRRQADNILVELKRLNPELRDNEYAVFKVMYVKDLTPGIG
jgi:hypothetical protein